MNKKKIEKNSSNKASRLHLFDMGRCCQIKKQQQHQHLFNESKRKPQPIRLYTYSIVTILVPARNIHIPKFNNNNFMESDNE